jgi:FtsZ-interacting cell division protein ZipA
MEGKLIAAIVISSIVALVAVITGVLFFLHRRRKHARQQGFELTKMDAYQVSHKSECFEKEGDEPRRVELVGDRQQRQELERNEKSVYEMYQMPVELDAACLAPKKGKIRAGEKQCSI